jgi:hypothetical protein
MALDTTLTLFCRGALTNHDREDDRPMGVTSVVAYLDGKELAHSERQLGTTVSEFDAELAALESGALLAQSLLVARPHSQITLLCPNPSAISAILNFGPHPGQRFSLSFKLTTDNLLSHRPDVKVVVSWAPQARALVGFARAKHLADTIAARPPPPNHREPHSISFQRSTSKLEAIDAWGVRWQDSDRRSQSYVALPHPPNGKLPPAIQGIKRGSRAAVSTLFRLITGHAFIGSYTARFRPDEPVDCPCGAPLQTVQHVITTCPLFAAASLEILAPIDRDYSLPILLGSARGGDAVLQFLKATQAGAHPRRVWNPG